MRFEVPAGRRVVATATQTGTTNIVALDVTVTNTSDTTCTTQGWATTVLRDNACIAPSGSCSPATEVLPRVVHSDGTPPTVVLAPGDNTVFSLTWTGGTLCPLAPAALEVNLPHATNTVRLSPVDLCATGDDGTPLQSTPLGTTEQWHPASN